MPACRQNANFGLASFAKLFETGVVSLFNNDKLVFGIPVRSLAAA